jgi:hypothetical protein
LVDEGGKWGDSKQKLNKADGGQNEISDVQGGQENSKKKSKK